MYNVKYSTCAFVANKKQELLIITKKIPYFVFGLNLEVLCSRTVLLDDIGALH